MDTESFLAEIRKYKDQNRNKPKPSQIDHSCSIVFDSQGRLRVKSAGKLDTVPAYDPHLRRKLEPVPYPSQRNIPLSIEHDTSLPVHYASYGEQVALEYAVPFVDTELAELSTADVVFHTPSVELIGPPELLHFFSPLFISIPVIQEYTECKFCKQDASWSRIYPCKLCRAAMIGRFRLPLFLHCACHSEKHCALRPQDVPVYEGTSTVRVCLVREQLRDMRGKYLRSKPVYNIYVERCGIEVLEDPKTIADHRLLMCLQRMCATVNRPHFIMGSEAIIARILQWYMWESGLSYKRVLSMRTLSYLCLSRPRRKPPWL